MPGDSFSFKQKEAFWKQSISASHKLWCNCSDYRNHFSWPGFLGINGSGKSMDLGLEEQEAIAAAIMADSGGKDDQEADVDKSVQVDFELGDPR